MKGSINAGGRLSWVFRVMKCSWLVWPLWARIWNDYKLRGLIITIDRWAAAGSHYKCIRSVHGSVGTAPGAGWWCDDMMAVMGRVTMTSTHHVIRTDFPSHTSHQLLFVMLNSFSLVFADKEGKWSFVSYYLSIYFLNLNSPCCKLQMFSPRLIL